MRKLSDEEIQKMLIEVECQKTWREKFKTKLHMLAQKFRPSTLKKQPESLTDDEIQSLLTAVAKQTEANNHEMEK